MKIGLGTSLGFQLAARSGQARPGKARAIGIKLLFTDKIGQSVKIQFTLIGGSLSYFSTFSCVLWCFNFSICRCVYIHLSSFHTLLSYHPNSINVFLRLGFNKYKVFVQCYLTECESQVTERSNSFILYLLALRHLKFKIRRPTISWDGKPMHSNSKQLWLNWQWSQITFVVTTNGGLQITTVGLASWGLRRLIWDWNV